MSDDGKQTSAPEHASGDRFVVVDGTKAFTSQQLATTQVEPAIKGGNDAYLQMVAHVSSQAPPQEKKQ